MVVLCFDNVFCPNSTFHLFLWASHPTPFSLFPLMMIDPSKTFFLKKKLFQNIRPAASCPRRCPGIANPLLGVKKPNHGQTKSFSTRTHKVPRCQHPKTQSFPARTHKNTKVPHPNVPSVRNVAVKSPPTQPSPPFVYCVMVSAVYCTCWSACSPLCLSLELAVLSKIEFVVPKESPICSSSRYAQVANSRASCCSNHFRSHAFVCTRSKDRKRICDLFPVTRSVCVRSKVGCVYVTF